MPYVLINEQGVVEAVSNSPIFNKTSKELFIKKRMFIDDLIGKKVTTSQFPHIRLAVICNWNAKCGISTYSKFICEKLKGLVGEIRIFSEIDGDESTDAENNVERCWKRGESLNGTVNKIIEWKADFVLIQHEFGIFPAATHFLQMLGKLSNIPHAVVLHSVYEHLDKTIHTAAIKNIIVHSEQAKNVLLKSGHNNDIFVIPHGCVVFDEVKELWNTFNTPYAIIQFGFGFAYKGVDRAIKAIAYLKKTDPKFKNIFYCYLCSETNHAAHIQSKYVEDLQKLSKELDVEENIAIIQKFHSEEVINNYLRTAKLALFPYVVDSDNKVFGASGAVRIAMANKIPTIASESHLFDDMEGILPRPINEMALAREIDEIFSCQIYRDSIIYKSQKYINSNNWMITADRYMMTFKQIIEQVSI